MSLFNFICEECTETTSEFFWPKEEKTPPICERCSGKTYRDWTIGNHHTTGDKGRLSSALGVHPSQIASGEAEKIHPGAQYNHRGDMILKNRAEQKQRLNERGWVNRD